MRGRCRLKDWRRHREATFVWPPIGTPTAVTPATILSDSAEGPHALGEAISSDPTHHVPDWYDLSMPVQHVGQAASESLN